MRLRYRNLDYSTASNYFLSSGSDQERVVSDNPIQSTLEWYVRECSSLVGSCQIEWQLAERVLNDPYLLQLITSMLKDPVLREFGIKALRRAVICHRDDWLRVESLCQLAFENGCAQEALMAAELLLPQVDGEQKWAIDAIRLATLARIDQQDAHQAAIHGYRQRWSQTERIFPYPLDLLRVMDHVEGDMMPLRRHLLSHCERSQKAVELAYRDVVEGKWHDTLPEWQALFEKNPQDRYFLFRLTEGLLETSVDRTKMRETYDKVIKEWKKYDHLPAWRNKVCSVLFLLQADIPAYEAHLKQAHLSDHWLITKAARRYVEMLLVEQKWDALLRFVNRKDIELLRYVCNSYQEFYLFKLLERLAEDEAEITDWNQWCHLWEELISLPLEERWLIAVLQRFATIHKQLSKKAHPITFSIYFSDVERQLSRRGKALAERWLASKPITEHEALRQRLKESVMLDDLLQLLRTEFM